MAPFDSLRSLRAGFKAVALPPKNTKGAACWLRLFEFLSYFQFSNSQEINCIWSKNFWRVECGSYKKVLNEGIDISAGGSWRSEWGQGTVC